MIKIQKKITGYQVVKPSDIPKPPPGAAPSSFVNEADRRLMFKGVPTPLAKSLRWEKRPVLTQGNPGWTYAINSPEGKFAVFVGHIQNGTHVTGSPFEVWVNGNTQPRGLSALAMSLSIDMRSRDRGFLKKKLDALSECSGTPFDGYMPDGTLVRFPGAVAAFARMVQWRCQELGAFEQHQDCTSIVDALMCKKEPKTTPDGALGWYCDVKNPSTGDDFVMLLKEGELENGQRRPFSVWMAKNIPKSIEEGLCVSLSLDMQVVEPEWVGRKLRQLVDFDEPRSEFFAQVPGSEKHKTYPSTVAYIANVILHRFAQLGLLTETGETIKENGVVQLSLIDCGSLQQANDDVVIKGALCTECKSYSVVKTDGGCDMCKSCGASKCS